MLVHSIKADGALSNLGASTKFNTDWRFLTMLRDRGRGTAAEWLDEHYADIGKRATIDLGKTCSTKTAGIQEAE